MQVRAQDCLFGMACGKAPHSVKVLEPGKILISSLQPCLSPRDHPGHQRLPGSAWPISAYHEELSF